MSDAAVPVLPADRSLGSLDAHLTAALRGEPGAVDAVLRAIRPLVVRYCRSRLGRTRQSFASADDVAQEVCLAITLALPHYQDQGRPFLAFVYRTAANKVADAGRAAARNRAIPVGNLATLDYPDTIPDPDGPGRPAAGTHQRGEGPGREAAPRRVELPSPRPGRRLTTSVERRQDTFPEPEEIALRGESTVRARRLLDSLPARQRDILIMRVVNGLSAEETADALGSTPGAVRVAQHRALAQLRRTLTAAAPGTPGRHQPHAS